MSSRVASDDEGPPILVVDHTVLLVYLCVLREVLHRVYGGGCINSMVVPSGSRT